MRRCTILQHNLWSAHVTPRRATVTQLYDQLVKKDIIQLDEDQRRMADACTPLVNLLQSADTKRQPSSALQTPPVRGTAVASPLGSARPLQREWWRRARRRVLSRFSSTPSDLDVLRAECLEPWQKRGLYLWGNVGIGKTMMLDLFDLVDTDLPKRRTHLHSFMVDLSDRLVMAEQALTQRRRMATTEKEKEQLKPVRPIDVVVDDVLAESPVLCFDEFQTFDVAHAALLSAFFTAALQRGLFLFTTSNRPPEELCTISSSFRTLLPVLYAHCNVVECGGISDYRKRQLSTSCHSRTYLYPASKEATEAIVARVELGHRRRLSSAPMDSTTTQPLVQEVAWVKDDVLWHHGRAMVIPYRCGGAALFDFGDIIGNQRQDLCSADFQLLAANYHTVIITNVPQMGVLNQNVAHQFIVLVDELYQANVKLLLTTQVPWKALLSSEGFGTGVEALDSSANLYTEGEDERSGYKASYQFENEEELMSLSRIQSRLAEMGCAHYLLRDHAKFVVSDFDFAALIEDDHHSETRRALDDARR